MAAPAKRPKDGQHNVSWGQVRIREYARSLSSGGIPEGEPGCKYPLGLCDVVVVRGENGEIAHGVELLTGAVIPPSALGMEDSVSNGESSSTARSTNSANTSIAQDSAAAMVDTAELADLQQVDRNGSSASNGAATTELSQDGSRTLRVGEFVAGSVEQFDIGRDAFRTNRALLKAQGKAGKKTPPAAILELLKRMEHCDAKQRHRLLLDEPCILRKAELDTVCQQLSAEYSVILKERAANNQGCRCGLLTAESLKMYKRDDLVEECKRRNVLPNGSKAQLMEKLIEHSAANLGCTHRMCTLLARLEARISADSGVASGSSAGAAAEEAGRPGDAAATRRAVPTGVSDPPSPSSMSAESVKSMSETREDEVNVKLARLKESLPSGSVLALPEDPRQRKAFVRAFLLQDDLKQPDTAAVEEVKKNSSCPCEAEGVGCHYNTCACDSDACDNRHLWDPSSAVYADRLFELHRAAVHFLNASWQVNSAARDAAAGASGGESEEQVGDCAVGGGGFGGTGAKAAQAAKGKRRKIAGGASVTAIPTNVLHLPGGITIEVPGGMPSDGPFFTAEQVVWTMRVVEHILLADDDEDEVGTGDVEEEGEEEEHGRNGTAATTVSAASLSVYSSSSGTHASSSATMGMGVGGAFKLSAEEEEDGEGNCRDADSATTEEEAAQDGSGLNTPLLTGKRGRKISACSASHSGRSSEEGAGRKGRKRKMSSEGEESDGSASSDTGSSGKRARGKRAGGSTALRAGSGSVGAGTGTSAGKGELSMAAGEAAAAAAAHYGQMHAYHHTHVHAAVDPFEPPAHGVSALEFGLLREIYGEEGLAPLGPVAHDPAMFPVSPAQEGIGVLAVWSTVKSMPEAALHKLAALTAQSASQGTMATLAWLELKARSNGSLISVVDGIASQAAQNAEDNGPGWLASRLRTYFGPADGAAIVRRVLHLCSEQQHAGHGHGHGRGAASKPTSPAKRSDEASSLQAASPSAAFQAEAKQLILQQLADGGV